MSYTDGLQRLKLPTLKCRILRGDMIEVFKITQYIRSRCHLNWNITWDVAVEAININLSITFYYDL